MIVYLFALALVWNALPIMFIIKVFQGRRNQMTDVCERASGNVKASKNIGDYYDARLGR